MLNNMLTSPGVVKVYDIMPSYSVYSLALTRQVSTIPQADFELRHVDVQCQVGGSDCGLFAIATLLYVLALIPLLAATSKHTSLSMF